MPMAAVGNAAYALLEPNLRLRPDKVAFTCQGRDLTFAGLAQGAAAFARTIEKYGIRPGERVLLALPDSLAFVAAFLGSMLHGAVPTPVNILYKREYYEFVLSDCQAAALVVAPDTEAAGAASPHLRARLPLDDAALLDLAVSTPAELSPRPETGFGFMLYTSGSTGRPKGVPHAGADLLFAADHYAGAVLGMAETDRVFSIAKMYHAYGLGNSLTFPLRFGATTLLDPNKAAAAATVELLAAFKPTLFFAVPSFYALLIPYLAGTAKPDSIRLCVSAGEALPEAVFIAWLKATDLPILDGIGSTEATHIFISNRPDDIRPGSSGQIVPGYEAVLIDDDGAETPTGPGSLHIRGGSLAKAYWNRPEATAQTMLPGGWLATGDVYRRDEDGYFTHLGRKDDMLKVGGNWVSPQTVENALLTHPDVAECAVVACQLSGLTHIKAYIVPTKPNPDEPSLKAALRRHLLESLPDFMCPSLFVCCKELPKTDTGKLARKVLREREE